MKEWTDDMDVRIATAVQFAMEIGTVREGTPLVVVTGWRAGSGYTNTMRIITAPEQKKALADLQVVRSSGCLEELDQ